MLFPGPRGAAALPVVLTGSPAEENLTERIQLRDPRAMRELYRLYGRSIYSLALRTVRSPLEAEEVTLEAFLRTWSLIANEVETRRPRDLLLTESRRLALERLHPGDSSAVAKGNPFLDGFSGIPPERLPAAGVAVRHLGTAETALLDTFLFRNRSLEEGSAELEQDAELTAAQLRQVLSSLAEEAGLPADNCPVCGRRQSLLPGRLRAVSGCDGCRTLPRQTADLWASILLLVGEQAPSRQLRERVLSLVLAGPGRVYHVVAWVLVAGLSLAVIRTGRDNAAKLAEVKRMRAEVSSVSGLKLTPLNFSPLAQPAAGAIRGTYYAAPGALLLLASSLPKLPARRTWQMWVLGPGDSVRSAGIFRPDESGTAVHLYRWDPSAGTPLRAAISDEPEPGTRVPTTPLQLITPLR